MAFSHFPLLFFWHDDIKNCFTLNCDTFDENVETLLKIEDGLIKYVCAHFDDRFADENLLSKYFITRMKLK